MRNKTNTYLILLIIIALSLVTAYAYLSVYISGLTDKTTEIKTDIESMRIKLAHTRKLNVSAEKTQDERKTVMSYFLNPDQVVDFVTNLESVAGNFGLLYTINSIENIDFGTLPESNKELLKVSMSLSGSWSTILRFLAYIETMPYAVHIDKLDINSNSTGAPASVGTSSKVSNSTWSMSVIFSIIKNKENER
jgi:Tfp pilus assembly protein PilO